MSRLQKRRMSDNVVLFIINVILLITNILGICIPCYFDSTKSVEDPNKMDEKVEVRQIANEMMQNALGSAFIGLPDKELDPRSACVIITNGYGHGSGVHIGDGIILTAGHCIDVDGTWVLDNAGRTYAIIDQWKDPFGEDVGFIRIRNKNLPKLNFGKMAEVKDTIWVIGTPLDLCNSFNMTKGIVTRTMTDMPGLWYDVMLIDAATYPGNSGGPVLNEDNEIVGILVGGYVGYDNLNIVESVSDILWALETYKEK